LVLVQNLNDISYRKNLIQQNNPYALSQFAKENNIKELHANLNNNDENLETNNLPQITNNINMDYIAEESINEENNYWDYEQKFLEEQNMENKNINENNTEKTENKRDNLKSAIGGRKMHPKSAKPIN
jgi:hypothetical protein